ncbi:hypothetical protein P9272_02225 [Mesorhizobium sp. WSM4976]|uniref:hypothetical protein n=1 Tax=Mesorhizobium sp. WSM4976 TaxID=3038549 RepID=UPI0024173B50|nr:hypothetical protein [Mesorhizobium sp. WSM4976]MDG4892419.1 hypothetical protein [Mesorhizobium sp. WSM4976]
MTTAMPLARYGAAEGALASGFIIAELHHLAGHDHYLGPAARQEYWPNSNSPFGARHFASAEVAAAIPANAAAETNNPKFRWFNSVLQSD